MTLWNINTSEPWNELIMFKLCAFKFLILEWMVINLIWYAKTDLMPLMLADSLALISRKQTNFAYANSDRWIKSSKRPRLWYLSSKNFKQMKLDMVTSNFKTSANYFTTTEPSKALKSKQSNQPSILYIELLLALHQALERLHFLPECFTPIRNTVGTTTKQSINK